MNRNLYDLLICRILDNFLKNIQKKRNFMIKKEIENKYFLQTSKKSYILESQTITFFQKFHWG